MASLVDFERGDPFRESEERRSVFLDQQADRERELARERDLNAAMQAGLQKLLSPPASPTAPSSSPPSGPSPSPGAGTQVASAGASPAAPSRPVLQGPSPLRGVQAPGIGSDPLLQELVRRPSTAQAGFQRYTQLNEAQAAAQQREDEIEGQALDALAAGDLTTYQVLAAKTGLDQQIPPQIIADARSRQTVVRATKLAEQFYKEDRQQAGAFFQAMMANGGNVQAAVQAAGLPRNRPDVRLETILLGDQRVLAIIDQMSGIARPVTTEGGDMVQADPRAGTGAAKVPAQLQVVEWVRTNMTGPNGEQLTADQAWQIANAAKQNPTNAIARVWATVFQDTFSREEADRAAAEFGQFLQQFNPAAAMTGGAAPQDPMAQPQQPMGGQLPGVTRQPSSGRPQMRFNPETRDIE